MELASSFLFHTRVENTHIYGGKDPNVKFDLSSFLVMNNDLDIWRKAEKRMEEFMNG